MTTDDFLRLFAEHAGKKKWFLKNKTYLRTSDDECPICFLDNQVNCFGKVVNDFCYWKTKLFSLMDPLEIANIVHCADCNPNKEYCPNDWKLRQKLLKICKVGFAEKASHEPEKETPASPSPSPTFVDFAPIPFCSTPDYYKHLAEYPHGGFDYTV